MTDITKLRIAVGKQLGYTAEESETPSKLSQADAVKLADYVFAYIANHPDEFAASQVAIAKQHFASWGTNTPLEDPSFDWGLLASEIGNNALKAGEDIASIGKGVLNLASMGKWLIPTIGIILAGIVVYKFYKAGDIIPKLQK